MVSTHIYAQFQQSTYIHIYTPPHIICLNLEGSTQIQGQGTEIWQSKL
jgi:hypothetical protein